MINRSVPLVGREAEMSLVTTALDASPAAAVVIAGRAGVGKSRLAAEVASRTGRPVTHVIATQGASTIPFGAFAALLPNVAALTDHPVELIRIFSNAIADQAQDSRPILVVLDDAQFLDTGSAALVQQLVLTGACSLIATLRVGEVTPESIVSLWKEGLAQRFDIHDLSRRETEALVASYLGGPVAGSALRWLWDVSAGNPLFIREVLIGAQESGAAYEQGGIWFLRLPLPAPPRLQDLIASRLEAVAPQTAEVVDLVAIGEPLGFTELATLTSLEALEEAEARGLIVMSDDRGRSQVRLSHPLYRDVVQQRIPRTRLRRLSGTLADTIEATGARRRDDIMRLAQWRLDAGSTGHAELFERAARAARAAHATSLAARFAAAALKSGGGVTAGLFLGETEFAAGRHAEAEKLFVSLAPLCRTDEETSLIANARAYNLGVLMGDYPAANGVIQDALAIVQTPRSRDRLLVRQAIHDLYAGRLSAALAQADALVESSDVITLRRGRHVRSIALALLGRTEEAVSISYLTVEEHRASAAQLAEGAIADFQPPETHLIGSVLGHVIGGRLHAAEADARQGGDVALDLNNPEFRATFSMLLAVVLIERGLVREAAERFREAAAINREIADLPTLRWCVGGVALAEGMSGQAAAAAEAVAELDTLDDHWFIALAPPMVDRGRAWNLIASGQLSAGRTYLHDMAEQARAREAFAWEATLLHDLVRLGDAKTVAPRLAELALLMDGGMVRAYAAHAVARMAADPAVLEATATAFEKMGAWMLAAEAMHAASVAAEAEGQRRQGSALSRESTRLYHLCGDVRSPLAVEVDTVVPLTRREMEIALLAAPGASGKAIAEKLGLSVRTVENHLQHVYAKLGVSNREGLAAALGDAGPGLAR